MTGQFDGGNPAPEVSLVTVGAGEMHDRLGGVHRLPAEGTFPLVSRRCQPRSQMVRRRLVVRFVAMRVRSRSPRAPC
jgi:hypothetical protein